jgi:hypothetical protein
MKEKQSQVIRAEVRNQGLDCLGCPRNLRSLERSFPFTLTSHQICKRSAIRTTLFVKFAYHVQHRPLACVRPAKQTVRLLVGCASYNKLSYAQRFRICKPFFMPPWYLANDSFLACNLKVKKTDKNSMSLLSISPTLGVTSSRKDAEEYINFPFV